MGEPEGIDVIPICLDRYVAAIHAPSRLGPEIRATFHDVVVDDPGDGSHVVEIRGDAGHERLTIDGKSWDPGPDHTVSDQLIYSLMRATLDADRRRLHLHAGLVVRGSDGIVLAGNPGSGKSTLIAQLVGRGFDYVTDERVAVDENLVLTGLPKPITVVSPSFGVLAALDPRTTGRGTWSGRGWNLPASAIRPGSVAISGGASVIVFVEFSPTGATTVRPIHPIEAARRLLADSPDAGRFGVQALPLVASLCASLPLFEMAYSSGEAAAAALMTLLSCVAEREVIAVERLGPGEAPARSPRTVDHRLTPALRRGVTGVCLDGRCLIRLGSSGELLELDDVLSAWIRLADGRTTISDLVEQAADVAGTEASSLMPAAVAAFEKLAGLGVVTG